MDQDYIDALLERYLSLLDEYTRLRTRLSTLQSDVFHGIARANFAAERGLRYGRDQYDDRMQASRLLSITRGGEGSEGGEDAEGHVEYTVALKASEQQRGKEKKSGEEGDNATSTGDDETDADTHEQPREENKKAAKSNDPLRWFGLLTPMPLRHAQARSIETIEQVIPRIASVSAEMFNLEIEVRRARKKRAKAEAAERKEKHARAGGETDTVGGENITATATASATAVKAS